MILNSINIPMSLKNLYFSNAVVSYNTFVQLRPSLINLNL